MDFCNLSLAELKKRQSGIAIEGEGWERALSHGLTARTGVPLTRWFWQVLLLLGTIDSSVSNTVAVEAFAFDPLSSRKLCYC